MTSIWIFSKILCNLHIKLLFAERDRERHLKTEDVANVMIGREYLRNHKLHFAGTEHVRNIAEMALDFMAAAREYRVTHLPAERVTLRIGINTGTHFPVLQYTRLSSNLTTTYHLKAHASQALSA